MLNAAEKEGLMVLQAGPTWCASPRAWWLKTPTSMKASLRTRRGHADPRLIAIRADPSVGRLIRPGSPAVSPKPVQRGRRLPCRDPGKAFLFDCLS
jgi:hypothetical protein